MENENRRHKIIISTSDGEVELMGFVGNMSITELENILLDCGMCCDEEDWDQMNS